MDCISWINISCVSFRDMLKYFIRYIGQRGIQIECMRNKKNCFLFLFVWTRGACALMILWRKIGFKRDTFASVVKCKHRSPRFKIEHPWCSYTVKSEGMPATISISNISSVKYLAYVNETIILSSPLPHMVFLNSLKLKQ